jgi:transcriptional regulator with XRE-family HTH domain
MARPGSVLRQARRAAGMTQSEVAARSATSKNAVSMYETGAREPGAATFLRLLQATGSHLCVERFSDEQLRRGRVLSDLLAFASELPRRWPGDELHFPSGIWKR